MSRSHFTQVFERTIKKKSKKEHKQDKSATGFSEEEVIVEGIFDAFSKKNVKPVLRSGNCSEDMLQVSHLFLELA